VGEALLRRQALSRLALEDAVGREDHQAWVVEADEYGEYFGSVAVRKRGLVAVVTVGDQQLPVGEHLLDPVGRKAPEPSGLDLEVRGTVGPACRRDALVE